MNHWKDYNPEEGMLSETSDTIESTSNSTLAFAAGSKSGLKSTSSLPNKRKSNDTDPAGIAKRSRFKPSSLSGKKRGSSSIEENSFGIVAKSRRRNRKSSPTNASLKEDEENKSLSNSSWTCLKCSHINPSSRMQCEAAVEGRNAACRCWRGGKTPFKTAVKDQKRKRGEESNFHKSNGIDSLVNAKRARQGGNGVVLTLRTANDSSSNNVQHLGPALQGRLPPSFRSRKGGLVVNAGDNAIETICNTLALAKDKVTHVRRNSLVELYLRFGFDCLNNIFLPGKKAGKVQRKMVVFAPVGIEMTEDAFAQLNGTHGVRSSVNMGTVQSLCKRHDCFSLAEEGTGGLRFCPAHTVEACTKCGSSNVGRTSGGADGMCQMCYKNATRAKNEGNTCKYPSCNGICKGDNYGLYCSKKCKVQMTADRKAAKAAKKIKAK